MKTLDQISNHLGFLGYNIEKSEPKKEGEKIFFYAKHVKRNNLVFWEMAPLFSIFNITLTTDVNYKPEIAEYINKANSLLNLAKVFSFASEDGVITIRFEAIYIGEYIKETFGQFYDFIEGDQQKFNSLENFSKIFLNR